MITLFSSDGCFLPSLPSSLLCYYAKFLTQVPHILSTSFGLWLVLKGRIMVKNLPATAGDAVSIPRFRRYPGVGNGYSLQYSCLRNPWTDEPGGLQSTESPRVRNDWAHTHVHGTNTILFKARILEWVAISFSTGIFPTQGSTWVSCIAGRSFTVWATGEAQYHASYLIK